MLRSKLRVIAAASIAAATAWVFFLEYVPPFKTQHFYGDIEGYHYPLYVWANRAIREGRIPQWDSSIYSGMSFIANPQAAVFYPPNWFVYWKNAKRDGVRFLWIEILLVMHFALALVLGWLWLRTRFRSEAAGLIGGAAFAFSGFPLNETQHLGMVCGYAWYPLGLWGVDEAIEKNSWRPLLKTAAASALCFLAGYPTTWIVYCVCVISYALARQGIGIALRAVAALAFSLLLIMVQLAPAYESAYLKSREAVYGGGLPGGWFFYLQYLMPNYFDQSKQNPVGTSEESYMYLGALALVGITAAFACRRWREAMPALAITFASWLVIYDPGGLIVRTSQFAPIINESLRQWNFAGAITLAGAYLAACGIAAIRRPHPMLSNPSIGWGAAALAAAWTVRLWMIWFAEGTGFARGWWSAAEVLLTACLALLLLLHRANRAALIVLVALIFTEYKVYGTNRRFNSGAGNVDELLSADKRTGGFQFQGVDGRTYAKMLSNPEYRVAANEGLPATDFRYYRLSTPQGFDPFLTQSYQRHIERFTPFATNRIFLVDLKNDAMLEDLAIRYVLAASDSKSRELLEHDTRFQLLGDPDSYFRVYEYLNAKPAWRFPAGSARRFDWQPERRLLKVESDNGGELELIEQWFPGWKAFIDGQEVELKKSRDVFQSVRVPAGAHFVEFTYKSQSLRIGAGISIAALIALAALLRIVK